MDAAPGLHPTDQTLHAYCAGKLSDGPADSVQQHLESCPECRRRIDELSSGISLSRPGDPPAPQEGSGTGWSQLGASGTDRGPVGAAIAPPPASSLPPGLGDHPDYEVLRELGRGGMGVVYLVRNKLMGRDEVFKIVNRRGVLDRFLTEIRNAARLHHANIVTAYSALRLGESLVLAMEYVEGLDLARMVKARGPLPVAHACSFVHQAALGLQHAHEHGMVHRDIKPSNLMLSRQGNRAVVKVLDFGLAKVSREGPVDGGMTHEGQMLGTPDYIAPEQISDARSADIRADIYSLGCTFYYLLTGGPPFRGTSLYDILQAHHSRDALPLNLARPEVPVELAALVAKMMAKEPERRFQTPKEVAQALKPFFKGGTTETERPISEAFHAEATGAGGPGAAIASAPAPSKAYPVAEPRKPAGSVRPRPPETLAIETSTDDRDEDSVPEAIPDRGKPWLWPSVATGVVILGLMVAGAVMGLRRGAGLVVLDGLPPGAEVFVDGDRMPVTRPKAGQPAEISVRPGKHEIAVKQDGFRTQQEDVTIESGGRQTFRVSLSPSERPGGSTPVAAPPGTSPTSPGTQILASLPEDHKPSEIAASAPADIAGDGPADVVHDVDLTGGPIVTRELLPAGDSEGGGPTWAYATINPGNRWAEPDFDDSSWRRGQPGFGMANTPGIQVRTIWSTGIIWLRAEFDVPALRSSDMIILHLFHDEGVSIFVNGKLFYESRRQLSGYRDIIIDPRAKFLLRPKARNVIAVLCKNTRGGQGVDVGLKVRGRMRSAPGRGEPSTVAVTTPAQPARPGEERDDNGLKMKFCWCPPGTFVMGSPTNDRRRTPSEGGVLGPIRVILTRGFSMGKVEVTQDQWLKIMGKTVRDQLAGVKKRAPNLSLTLAGEGPDHPIYYVTHQEATEFCRRLTEAERGAGRLPAGWAYRLPTEAQWEYACRAGTETRYCFGGNDEGLVDYAWFARSGSDGNTMPVGRRKPNRWGLHDVHGNVNEWCYDVYETRLRGGRDPQGPENNGADAEHVCRGGSCREGTSECRSARRLGVSPSSRPGLIGFRVALVPPE